MTRPTRARFANEFKHPSREDLMLRWAVATYAPELLEQITRIMERSHGC